MKTDDFFEALSDIDDELIANAKPIHAPEELVARRAPLLKTMASFAAVAACAAVLVVGGIFGVKYLGGRNAVETSPSNPGNSSGITTSSCMAYAPAEYPKDAKYVYKGDYSELDYTDILDVNAIVYSSFEELAEISDLIVSGKFTDRAHQTVDTALPHVSFEEVSYNTFYIDRVVKGDKKSGDAIAVAQFSTVHEGEIYSGPMAPMICGDRWIYFLNERDGYYTPVSSVQGRYPLPFIQNKSLKECGEYGYYGNNNRNAYQTAVYLETLNEFGFAVTQNFDGVILSVMTDKNSYRQGEEIKVTATVLNTTNEPIGLLMPVQGEGSHTEISTHITRAERYLTDVSVGGLGFDTAMDSHNVQPSEDYVQEMTFGTFYGYEDKETAMPGIYKGTASIILLSDPNYTESVRMCCEVDFEIEITGDENIQPPVELIADFYDRNAEHNDSIRFTMSEFPDVEFEFTAAGVYANGEQLFGDMTVFSVYLCDMNGDGKREIISCCNGFSAKRINCDYIKVCDYANSRKLYYYYYDPFFYDTWLTVKDGSLIAMRTCKADYSPDRETSKFPLTFDMLEEYPLRTEKPVKNYTSFDDIPYSDNDTQDGVIFCLDYYCENKNEPVYSTVNGTIGEINYSVSHGYYISVIGENECFYHFEGLKSDESFVKVGDKVTAGQRIGTVGNSGEWQLGAAGVRYCCALDKLV